MMAARGYLAPPRSRSNKYRHAIAGRRGGMQIFVTILAGWATMVPVASADTIVSINAKIKYKMRTHPH